MLKPISFERFVKAVDKVFDRLQPKALSVSSSNLDQTPTRNPEYIFVKS